MRIKCPCCNGTGRTPMVTIVKTDSGLPCDFPCIECNGTGEVEMTNEYFLRTASTEQLAEFLVEHAEELTAPDGDYHKHVERFVVEWLQKEHKE